MRQRVMIAMALSCEPKLLIADEPTTALDVTIQAQILELLQRLRVELGMALMLITHDLGVVAGIVDRVNVMYAGYIVETATVAATYADPRHPYTLGLMSSIPRDRPAARRAAQPHHRRPARPHRRAAGLPLRAPLPVLRAPVGLREPAPRAQGAGPLGRLLGRCTDGAAARAGRDAGRGRGGGSIRHRRGRDRGRRQGAGR